MQPFTSITSVATPFPQVNVDTDIIIAGEFLKTTKRTGLGRHAFHSVRYDVNGHHIADNIFDRTPYCRAEILVAGQNFGCGSSREHAPWAIADMGYRCIVASGFADIFAGNCAKNGIVTVTLPQDQVDVLECEAEACREITVDLVAKSIILAEGMAFPFDYNPVHRHLLLNGLDEIGQTLQNEDVITKYEKERMHVTPWQF